MSQCDCANAGEPRDIIDLYTPLYQACGGRLYRLHVTTSAAAVLMGDGASVETRVNSLERALLANTTTYFADSITGRDAIAPLTPGDRCFVFDASSDATVPYGSAMYIWLPSRKWHKLYNGDSPLDALNLIKDKGGLAADKNRLYVKVSDIIGQGLKDDSGKIAVDLSQLTGAGITVDSQGKISVKVDSLGDDAISKLAEKLIATGQGLKVLSGKLAVKVEELIKAGGGLKAENGKLAVDFSQISSGELASVSGAITKPGAGLAVGSDGKLYVDFSTMPAETLKSMILPLIQTGGGLMVDSSGKIYFDAESMDTAVFDKMLKALWIPKPLTKNTIFHVNKNHAAAADTLDEGRGLSADLPFLSIQACLNYVAANYNLNKYSVYIQIAGGDYVENLVLPSYTTSTGVIYLMPYENADVHTHGYIYASKNNLIQFNNIKSHNVEGSSPQTSNYVHCFALDGGQVQFNECEFIFDTPNTKVINGLTAMNGSITFSGGTTDTYGLKIKVQSGVSVNGMLSVNAGSIIQRCNCVLEGNPTLLNPFISVSNAGAFQCVRTPGWNHLSWTGDATCKRYDVTLNGVISTQAAGPEFFPGNTAGTNTSGGQYL